MRRWLLALAFAASALPAGAPARDALAALDACVAQLDHGQDVGYQRIAARCPDLTQSLTQSEWAPWLPRDWNRSNNQLSADGLSELHALLSRTAPAAGGGREPDVAKLGAVLARVTQADAPRGGWWQRFKQWLREIFAPQPARAERGWLRRLFGALGISEALLQGIAWGALAIVVALAAAVVINELRVAGLLKRRPRRAGRAPRAAVRPAQVTLGDLEQASAAQQPQLLLQLVTLRLAEQDLLPPARALTLQEVLRAVRLPQPSDRERLRQLALTCEQLRFSDRAIAPQILATAVARGRELLATLQPPVAS